MDRRQFLAGTLGSAILGNGIARAAGHHPVVSALLPAGHRQVRLHLRFMTTRDGTPVERGREWASYDFNEDGTVTFRATSASSAPQVTRDVLATLDGNWWPRDAYVRLQVDGRHEGSGWFRFVDGAAEVETWNRTAGRRTGRQPLPAPVRGFNAHPVTNDLLLAAAYDRAKGGRQRLPDIYSSSTDSFGRDGPVLTPVSAYLEYAGRELRPTAAGAFEADRYRLFLRETDREPLEEMWALPGTLVFVHAQAGPPYDTTYELLEFGSA